MKILKLKTRSLKEQNYVPQGLQEHCTVEALPMLFLLLLADTIMEKALDLVSQLKPLSA